jgi:hypothetical protein
VALQDHTPSAVNIGLGRAVDGGWQFGGLRIGLNWWRSLFRNKGGVRAQVFGSAPHRPLTSRITLSEESVFDQTLAG